MASSGVPAVEPGLFVSPVRGTAPVIALNMVCLPFGVVIVPFVVPQLSDVLPVYSMMVSLIVISAINRAIPLVER